VWVERERGSEKQFRERDLYPVWIKMQLMMFLGLGTLESRNLSGSQGSVLCVG